MTFRREEFHTTIESIRSSTLTRRQFMRRTAALGLAVPSISTLLAACEINIGVDDDDEPDEPAVEPDDDDDDERDEDDEVEPDDDDDVAVDPDEDDDLPPEEVEVPELDLETLEAETVDGTLQAQRAENSFVGEIADGRVIGVAFTSEVEMADDPYDQDEIVVRLYDRQESAVLVGKLDDDGAAAFQSDEAGHFAAAADLVMEDDVVTGTVTFGDEEPTSFTADAATGVAGLYWALGDEDWDLKSVDWVVLDDGRQWGVICVVTTGPFCDVRTF